LISLLLARTYQFQTGVNAQGAHEVLGRIKGEYERAYFAGIIWERVGHASLERSGSGGGTTAAYHALREAMGYYEKAEKLSAAGNDDAILRWNTCAREIELRPEILPVQEEWRASEAGSRIADV
jgi:hypothetical protein